MSYYFSKTLSLPFADAIARTTEALNKEGFGIITDIDIAATFKTKIGAAFRPYRILGVCNPALAHEALTLEDKAGTMLPCNVIVQEHAPGNVEVSAIDPVASMASISNPPLLVKAAIVREKLSRVIGAL